MAIEDRKFELSYVDVHKLMYLLDDADYFTTMPKPYRDFWEELWQRIQTYRYDVENGTNYSNAEIKR